MSGWRELSPTARDAVAGIALALVWFATFEYWRDGGWLPTSPRTYVVAGVWSAATLGLRRLWPRSVLVAAVVAYPLVYGEPLVTEFHLLPVMIAGYSATSTGRERLPVAAAACAIATLALFSPSLAGDLLRGRGYSDGDVSRMLFAEFAIVGVVFLGYLERAQRRTAQALAARNAELEALRDYETRRAVAEERTRIARELHDVAAHHLTALIVRAQAADRVAATRPEVASESVGWIARTARDALAAIRQTVRLLRDADADGAVALKPGPTLVDLHTVVDRVRDAGLAVELVVPERLPALAPQAELAALRIAQESLTNTLRHANASRARVALETSPEGLWLTIDDDGRVAVPGPSPVRAGSGLAGMRERAASCGGRLEVGSNPLGGWRVQVFLPAVPLHLTA